MPQMLGMTHSYNASGSGIGMRPGPGGEISPTPWRPEHDKDALMQAARLGHDQNKFNALLNAIGGNGGNARWSSSGGMRGTAGIGGQGPRIDSGPIYNQGQINETVNREKAANAEGIQNEITRNEGDLSGRGFNMQGSPLSQYFQTSANQRRLATDTDIGYKVPFDLAKDNAQHVLKTQVANEEQFASRQREEIARDQIRSGQRNSLLAALAGLM